MMTLLRGKVAYVLKLIVVLLISVVMLMLTQHAVAQHEYAIAIFLAIAVILIAFTYLTQVSVPLKFFIPGLLLLFAFVLSPILYTVVMSEFNYKTGNILSKQQAIEQIVSRAVEPDANGTSFDIKIGVSNGVPALLASDTINKTYFLATEKSRTDLTPDQVTLDANEVAATAPNFRVLTPLEMQTADTKYSNARFYYGKTGYFITLEGFDVGIVSHQVLEYLPQQGIFKSLVDDSVYRDNGRGNFALVTDSSNMLNPGWRAPIWFENYTKLFTDAKVRGPLIRVFIWTMVFATGTVLTSFALGLLLAIAMNKPMRGRRFYRSILILPYAMPSVMSILIWAGMFDTEFGAINNILGTHIAWFQNPSFARFAVIFVNLWLAFPYFYLISSGALQAIPTELNEAAAIDGANPRQIFRKITLPLLLQILSPLLIASFAFNFNNFNLIYLLTGGGPRNVLSGEIAGGTDILISYTYKIAFGSNTQDLGLASAISVVIFVIVAGISLYGLRKSKVLETFK